MSVIDPNNELVNHFQADDLTSIKLNLFTKLKTNHSSKNLQSLRTMLGQMRAMMSSLFKDLGKKVNATSYPPAEFIVTETVVKEPSKKELFFTEEHQPARVPEKSLNTRRSRIYWWM